MPFLRPSFSFSPPRRHLLLGGGGWALGLAAHAVAIPPGGSQAHLKGVFGPLFDWPIIPIHATLLPDGRVLGFGSTVTGKQGGQLHYAVWDPALGQQADAFTVLPNTTGTDIFCAGQALLPNGQVLIVGGDRLVNGVRNYANNKVNLFDPRTDALRQQPQALRTQRWYATVVTNAQGEQVVMGGRDDRAYRASDGDEDDTPSTAATYAPTPEVRTVSGRWRTLSQASSEGAFVNGWFYPKAFLAPDGRIIIVNSAGQLYALDSRGLGRLASTAVKLPRGLAQLPLAQQRPGLAVTLRADGSAWQIDARAPNTAPAICPLPSPSALRRHGTLTTLPDGQLWLYGGSSGGNTLSGASYHGEFWQPGDPAWRPSASGRVARLYHSVALLLPDASVLTAGGGAPGPLTNLNAEIFYPPYLYRRDGSGQPALRPVIQEAPQSLTWGARWQLRMTDAQPIGRVVLIRAGAVTHNFNNEQRWLPLAFEQTGARLSGTVPNAVGELPTGFYLLFVWRADGVPSVARTVLVA